MCIYKYIGKRNRKKTSEQKRDINLTYNVPRNEQNETEKKKKKQQKQRRTKRGIHTHTHAQSRYVCKCLQHIGLLGICVRVRTPDSVRVCVWASVFVFVIVWRVRASIGTMYAYTFILTVACLFVLSAYFYVHCMYMPQFYSLWIFQFHFRTFSNAFISCDIVPYVFSTSQLYVDTYVYKYIYYIHFFIHEYEDRLCSHRHVCVYASECVCIGLCA